MGRCQRVWGICFDEVSKYFRPSEWAQTSLQLPGPCQCNWPDLLEIYQKPCMSSTRWLYRVQTTRSPSAHLCHIPHETTNPTSVISFHYCSHYRFVFNKYLSSSRQSRFSPRNSFLRYTVMAVDPLFAPLTLFSCLSATTTAKD